MQDVHFDRGHAVEIAFERIHWDEMAADVNEKPAPGKPGLILDGDRGRGKSRRCNLHKLEKSLQAAQSSERCRRCKFCAGIGDGEFVGFIFAEFLNCLATFVGMNLQRWCGTSLGTEWNSGLPRQLILEALDFAIERCVVTSSNGNGEGLRDRQLAIASLHAGGHGHQVELGLGLSQSEDR